MHLLNALRIKSKIVFFATLFLVGLAACKSNPEIIRIKKRISLISPEDSTIYSYTTDGKIKSLYKYPSTRVTYRYSKNQVTEIGNFPTPVTMTYHLNAMGVANSMEMKTDTSSYCFHYSYDENGILEKEEAGCIEKTPDLINVIDDGNVVKEIAYYRGGNYEESYKEYYSDKANVLFNANIFPFLGEDSKNLVKQVTVVRNSKDTTNVNLHNYHFDDKGRVSIDAIYGKSGELKDSVQYFY